MTISAFTAWRLDASALVEEYRQGASDPVTIVDLCLARIARIDPSLNAFVCLSPTAREEAAASAARWQSGAPIGPLDGVPVAVKDNLVVKGMPATFGSRLYAGTIAARDELPIRRLREAGAIIIGKTNTPEFAVEGYTSNDLFGVTRNPWAPALTPGGSSGGSVAAVAAGLVPVAIGTDGGGSTRRPAAYTGLVGLKPGIGHVPRADGLPQVLLDFEVVGTFTRSARDAALLDSVLSGSERADPASRCPPDAPAADQPLRILSVERIDANPCDPEIVTALHAAADAFAALGHRVTRTELPFDSAGLAAIWSSIAEIGLGRLLAVEPDFADKVNPKYVAMARRGAERSASDLLAILETVAALRRQTSERFADFDLILMPSCAAMPWAADTPFPDRIDGHTVGPRGHAVYTGWVNAAGLPAIALPCPVPPGTLPIGVQLIGDRGAEPTLLALAAAYEERCPWDDRWPDIAAS
ncbi:amidase [Aurantimonas coralicida]|uniref:amidase n=1 Tax=Aurantimonas coralicida TaxID=182270 RepID=UPI001E541392|nr:amidase [Aurantimonas coralicida]MCD1641687.1 amidase [Aurantimonas coralicida]